jgi:hypothetical protein
MHNGNFNDDDLKAPPRLVAALQQAAKKELFIPPTVDEAVTRSARERLARPECKRPSWLRLVLWSAAPATAMVVFLLLLRHSPGDFAREDLNHDGKVDILDAFQLARELHSGSPPAPSHDVNGDGLVNQLDVERIAADAVKLLKGGRS